MAIEIALTMMRAAREAEIAHHKQSGSGRLKQLPDALMQAIIDAAISAIGEDDEPEATAQPEPVEEPAPPLCQRMCG